MYLETGLANLAMIDWTNLIDATSCQSQSSHLKLARIEIYPSATVEVAAWTLGSLALDRALATAVFGMLETVVLVVLMLDDHDVDQEIWADLCYWFVDDLDDVEICCEIPFWSASSFDLGAWICAWHSWNEIWHVECQDLLVLPEEA